MFTNKKNMAMKKILWVVFGGNYFSLTTWINGVNIYP